MSDEVSWKVGVVLYMSIIAIILALALPASPKDPAPACLSTTEICEMCTAATWQLRTCVESGGDKKTCLDEAVEAAMGAARDAGGR
jgi:hypothetical protein